jgi:hypothetical protein
VPVHGVRAWAALARAQQRLVVWAIGRGELQKNGPKILLQF